MQAITDGLWHWQAPHPDWEEGASWDEVVSSYAIDHGERLFLFDPIDPPDEMLEMADQRDASIILTAPWHERDTNRLVDRLEVNLYAPPPDTAADLMEKYGISAERAGDGSPDLSWLSERDDIAWHRYGAGDQVAGLFEAFAGREHNDLVLWAESHAAVISGDTLVDVGDGLKINDAWLRDDVARAEVIEGMRPLLDRPVEHVLPTHGVPTDRAALERAVR